MGQKPPAWTRSDGQIGQVPLMLSRDVDSAGVHPTSGQDPNTMAEQMVRQRQPAINRFVAMQRQHIQLGDKDIHNAVLPLDGMDVYYNQVQGLERMHYHISPQAPGQIVPEQIIPQQIIPGPPVVEEAKVPEAPEIPEYKLEEPVHGEPTLLVLEIPCFLSVEFGNGAD